MAAFADPAGPDQHPRPSTENAPPEHGDDREHGAPPADVVAIWPPNRLTGPQEDAGPEPEDETLQDEGPVEDDDESPPDDEVPAPPAEADASPGETGEEPPTGLAPDETAAWVPAAGEWTDALREAFSPASAASTTAREEPPFSPEEAAPPADQDISPEDASSAPEMGGDAPAAGGEDVVPPAPPEGAPSASPADPGAASVHPSDAASPADPDAASPVDPGAASVHASASRPSPADPGAAASLPASDTTGTPASDAPPPLQGPAAGLQPSGGQPGALAIDRMADALDGALAPVRTPPRPEPPPAPPAAADEAPPPARTPRPVRALPRTIAIANQKGGVGKTTTAVNLGAGLAELGYRTLVVDLDPQGNATTGLGINARNLSASIYDVLMNETPIDDCVEPTAVRNLFVAPATIDLAGAEIELVPAFSRELRLRRALDQVTDDYDFILVDCPPSLGLITINGLAAVAEVLVPIQCEYYALEGLGQLMRNVKLVQSNLNARLEMSTIVLTMYDARTKLADQVVKEVRTHFGDKVCRNIVPRTVRLSEAPSFGQPILVFDPTSRGAIAYREIAKEVSGGAPQRAR